MNIEPTRLDRLKKCLMVFEQGTTHIIYDRNYVYNDGFDRKNRCKRRQVTLSIGFTEDSGELGNVIKAYCAQNGKFKDDFAPYIDKIGTGVLHDNMAFRELLTKASRQDPFFNTNQDRCFERLILYKGFDEADRLEIVTPLGILVIVDSILHGSLGRVRNLFTEVPPNLGGGERQFITAYVAHRRKWWLFHSNNPHMGDVGKGTYRMDCFIKAIEQDNWNLDKPLHSNGVIV